jgi:hypothetical protein
MKKLLFILLLTFPILGFSQYIQAPTHYEAQQTAQHILKGHIKMYITDSTRFVVEKRNENYVTYHGLEGDEIKSRLSKVFSKGKPEYSSRTNGGYLFFIAVVNRKNELDVINYVSFRVNAFTQKIEEIEILLDK